MVGWTGEFGKTGVWKQAKNTEKISPNSGHTRGGGEAKMESGHTFLRFFLEPSRTFITTQDKMD